MRIPIALHIFQMTISCKNLNLLSMLVEMYIFLSVVVILKLFSFSICFDNLHQIIILHSSNEYDVVRKMHFVLMLLTSFEACFHNILKDRISQFILACPRIAM